MSFFINNRNNQKPACINSQQLKNIAEKALIQVPRVFDACVHRIDSEVFNITLTDFTPANPTFPLNYISTINNPNVPVTISNLIVDRADGNGNFATVTATVNIPLLVSYTDANGVPGTATSSISITRSATLCVPQNSLTPIDITATAVFQSIIGSFPTDTTASITACVQIVFRAVGVVDLLVPTFGYPVLPLCQPQGDATCNAVFNTPIYPSRT